jgi:cytochrome c-type biogenesis protein CcmE
MRSDVAQAVLEVARQEWALRKGADFVILSTRFLKSKTGFSPKQIQKALGELVRSGALKRIPEVSKMSFVVTDNGTQPKIKA